MSRMNPGISRIVCVKRVEGVRMKDLREVGTKACIIGK